jgi:hypothetical protein
VIAASIDPEGVAPTDQILVLKDKIWTARRRTVRAVDSRASGPRIFNAAVLIAPVAAEDSAVEALAAIASVEVEDSVVAALVALADSAGAAVDSEVDAEN